MRKLLLPLLFLAMALPAQGNAAEKTYELTFTSEGYRENHDVYVHVWKPWFQEVEKRSNGRLKIEFYSPGVICSAKEVPDAVIKGRVDIGHSLFGANPGRYGYSDIGEANISANSSLAASVGFFNYVNDNPWVKEELDKTMKILTVWATGPMMVVSTSPIKAIADFKGKKVGYHVSGGDKIITAFGGVPVPVSPPDIYMSVQRHQTDTQLFALTIMKSFKLYEVLSDTMNFPMAPGYHYLVMNRDKWNELPADLQKILEETTGMTMTKQVGTTIDKGINEAVDFVVSNKKGSVNDISAESKAAFIDALVPFQKSWIADREKRGLSRASEALDLFKASLAKANSEYK